MLTKSKRMVFSLLTVLLAGLFLLATPAFADNPVISFTAAPVKTSDASGVKLTWRTGLELDTAGFNIYRGDEAGRPLEKLNPHLIPVGMDPIGGGTYSYLDTSAESGQTYRYQLETVGLGGVSTKSQFLVSRMPMAVTASADVVPWLPLELALFVMVGILMLGRRLPRMQQDLRSAYLSSR